MRLMLFRVTAKFPLPITCDCLALFLVTRRIDIAAAGAGAGPFGAKGATDGIKRDQCHGEKGMTESNEQWSLGKG
jgi:hypothetical protein